MANTYTLISSTVLSGLQTTVNFNSIPSTYTDLVLSWSVRSNWSSTVDYFTVKINNNSSNLDSQTSLSGNGTSVLTNRRTSDNGSVLNQAAGGATSLSNTFSNGMLYIPNYTVSQNRAMSTYYAQENNVTNAYINLIALYYQNNTSISSLNIVSGSGSFVANSSFYLYGIKNS